MHSKLVMQKPFVAHTSRSRVRVGGKTRQNRQTLMGQQKPLTGRVDTDTQARVLTYLTCAIATSGIPAVDQHLKKHAKSETGHTRSVWAQLVCALDPDQDDPSERLVVMRAVDLVGMQSSGSDRSPPTPESNRNPIRSGDNNDANCACACDNYVCSPCPISGASTAAPAEIENEIDVSVDNSDDMQIDNNNSDTSENPSPSATTNDPPKNKGGRKRKGEAGRGGARPGDYKRGPAAGVGKDSVARTTYVARCRNAVKGWARSVGATLNGGFKAVLQQAIESNSAVCDGCEEKGCTSDCHARDLVKNILFASKSGKVWDEMISEWEKENNTFVTARKRIKMEWQSGVSVDNFNWLLKEMGKNSKECGRRARDKEAKRIYQQVDELAKITSLPGDVEGVQCSIVQSIRIQLGDLETQGLLEKCEIPETLEYRFSFDGTVLSNGSSLVVVALVPLNLPVSCQSRASAIPVALLKCGEDRDMLREALKVVLEDIDRIQKRDMSWHGPRKVTISQSYDLASWWKILKQSWNSLCGNCPWCLANKDDNHNFAHWSKAELPTGVHPHSIIPIPMENCKYIMTLYHGVSHLYHSVSNLYLIILFVIFILQRAFALFTLC